MQRLRQCPSFNRSPSPTTKKVSGGAAYQFGDMQLDVDVMIQPVPSRP
jgi:hypothetical protein